MPTLTPTSEDARIYEFCILYPSNLSQKEESVLIKEIENTLGEGGGKQVSRDPWGKRGLAYAIKGHKKGNFIVYHYELMPEQVKEIDTALRITPNLLRHIVVTPPKNYEVIQYSESFTTWLKEREKDEERVHREREEKLAKKVADKAKRQVRIAEAKKKEETPSPAADASKISEQLEKIISDEDLNF